MKTIQFLHLPDPYPNEPGTPDDRLKRKAMAGLAERLTRFKQPGPLFASRAKAYQKRLNSELRAIQKAGFANYILIAADLVDYARQKGIRIGPGRGTANSSMVNYCLGITKIDPLQYGLIFERFITPSQDQLPSIDLDFCYEGRKEIVRYMKKKYGEEQVKRLRSCLCPHLRATVRGVGRILNLPVSKVDAIAKLIPWDSRDLKEAIEQEPRLKKMTESEPIIAQLFQIAVRIEGKVRLPDGPPSGFVLADQPISNFLPLYKIFLPTYKKYRGNDQSAGDIFDEAEARNLGLAIYYFIGLGILLSRIDHYLKLIRKNHSRQIDIDEIPLDDKKTWELFARADTEGVFLMEANGRKKLLRRLKPQNIEELAAVDTIHRPSLDKKDIPDSYIRRKQGKEKILKIHPVFHDITRETFGLILYQEQVMMIAHRLAGFTMDKAYIFLKQMLGKSEEMREQFIRGCVKNKLAKEKARLILEEIKRQAPVTFLKAHSIGYAILAFQTAWLKANYPEEFANSRLED